MSIFASNPLRMICHINPRIRCSLPSTKSEAPMLTVDNPSAFADVITRLLFSVIWKALIGFGAVEMGVPEAGRPGVRRAFEVALLRTRSSIVSGTESLMSFERIKPSVI